MWLPFIYKKKKESRFSVAPVNSKTIKNKNNNNNNNNNNTSSKREKYKFNSEQSVGTRRRFKHHIYFNKSQNVHVLNNNDERNGLSETKFLPNIRKNKNMSPDNAQALANVMHEMKNASPSNIRRYVSNKYKQTRRLKIINRLTFLGWLGA